MTEKMTAQEATTFNRKSATNAEILHFTANLKGCECEAYADWFTYNRWQVQGYQVQRGERGTKVTTYVHGEKEVTVNGVTTTKAYSYPRSTTVFCRCQV